MSTSTTESGSAKRMKSSPTPATLANARIGLVHDYLTQFGGAEQVLAVLQALFPDAPTLTTLYDRQMTLPGVDRAHIVESRLGWVPGLRRHHRLALSLFPLAMRDLSRHLRELDVVVADTSAWAHQVSLADWQALVVYCHSPARFLYGDAHYLGATGLSGRRERLLSRILAPYRRLDRRAYQRADVLLVNSETVAARLRCQVGVEAEVVYPPVDVDWFSPAAGTSPEDWYLVASRLVPHKRIDLAIETATRHDLPLKVLGAGRDERRLRRMAGPTVEFLGFQSPEVVRSHLQRCRAFILPGMEDFGISAVEAQAAGRPVIAFAAGGALETVVDGVTGVRFERQTASSLREAMLRLEAHAIEQAGCQRNAMRFDRSHFEAGILSAVERALALRRR